MDWFWFLVSLFSHEWQKSIVIKVGLHYKYYTLYSTFYIVHGLLIHHLSDLARTFLKYLNFGMSNFFLSISLFKTKSCRPEHWFIYILIYIFSYSSYMQTQNKCWSGAWGVQLWVSSMGLCPRLASTKTAHDSSRALPKDRSNLHFW